VSIADLWYKNAIIYCLDVEKYQDANDDGIGDFEGLMRRLDYLQGLGVTCLWLQPFYPSPNRDNGYDVTDFYGVHEKHGSLGDFVAFMRYADALGIRVIIDLVVNHTSIDSPWFQQARSHPRGFFHDWYVWSDVRPKNHKDGIVFPGEQTSTWTKDRRAGKYYFHRFYDHQPDLNTWHPYVRAEIQKIMGFWLQLGVSGFRMDAVPFLIEKKGPGVEHQMDFNLLKEMRDFLQWRSGDAIMLAEANVPPEESLEYFGSEGDRLQMMLNFPVNQRLFYALATADLDPLIQALEATRQRPANAQWVQFLRSHDELDLGRLTAEQRQKVFDAFGPEKRMQLYNRGIRRRLTPMLANDRKRLELAFSLLFSLPGTPMMQYGDEIGIGDNLRLPERECARTPMQWSASPHAGFSGARRIIRPVIDDKVYGYTRVNVAEQRRDPESILNWTERMIRARKECPEISWGGYTVLRTNAPEVLVMRYDWRRTSLVTVHNFASSRKNVKVKIDSPRDEVMVDVFDGHHSRRQSDGMHRIALDPHAWRWYRVGGPDNAPDRSDLDLTNPKR
jgi:maltose alpha-D-glucosyltransferase/alpha-amylase